VKIGAINKQIIGGENATLGQFPWQVVMMIDDAWMCGGSLILRNWVMTAAHCAGYD
jgi:secreted trypsin-like serine protease